MKDRALLRLQCEFQDDYPTRLPEDAIDAAIHWAKENRANSLFRWIDPEDAW